MEAEFIASEFTERKTRYESSVGGPLGVLLGALSLRLMMITSMNTTKNLTTAGLEKT